MPDYHCPQPHGDYARLAKHLAGRPDSPVTLTFAEVEAIIGWTLPLAAKLGRGWWRGTGPGRTPHGSAWEAAGWRVERVDEYAGPLAAAATLRGGGAAHA